MSKVIVSASPADVRAWAIESKWGADEGYVVGGRGKFPQALIKDYNKSHGVKYRQGQHVKTVSVKAKPAKGRTVERKVSVPAVRAAAREAGIPVGSKGRLPQDVLDAFVLGTMSDLAAQADNAILAAGE